MRWREWLGSDGSWRWVVTVRPCKASSSTATPPVLSQVSDMPTAWPCTRRVAARSGLSGVWENDTNGTPLTTVTAQRRKCSLKRQRGKQWQHDRWQRRDAPGARPSSGTCSVQTRPRTITRSAETTCPGPAWWSFTCTRTSHSRCAGSVARTGAAVQAAASPSLPTSSLALCAVTLKMLTSSGTLRLFVMRTATVLASSIAHSICTTPTATRAWRKSQHRARMRLEPSSHLPRATPTHLVLRLCLPSPAKEKHAGCCSRLAVSLAPPLAFRDHSIGQLWYS